MKLLGISLSTVNSSADLRNPPKRESTVARFYGYRILEVLRDMINEWESPSASAWVDSCINQAGLL